MKPVNCPYIKISEAEAQKFVVNFGNVSGNLALTQTAYAQDTQVGIGENVTSATASLSDQLTTPFLLLVGSFFLFVILMSVVYVYHWFKFSLNDPFIKNFTPIYFIGITLLSSLLIINLFF